MGKVKQANGKAAKAAKPVSAVKNASVTKATDSPKAKSKKVAKEVASKAATNGKEKSKKSKKVETESESDSDASDDSDSDSASDAEDSDSDDSDSSSESEADNKTKKAAPKTNGTAAKPAAAKPAAVNGKAKGKTATPESSDSSDSSDDEADDDSDDSEDDAATKAKPAVVTKEKAKAKAEKSDEDSDDSDDSEEDSDDSDDSESEDEKKPETKSEPSKKRKADEEDSAPIKKNKTETSEDEFTTLFVGNLGWGIDDNLLYEAFKECAGLNNARVVTDKAMQRSRGFGYVDFDTQENAQAALDKMNGFELEGRGLRLDPSKPRPAEDATPGARANERAKQHGDSVSPESDTLFVGNLPFDADEDVVSEFFGDVAQVKSLRLPTDQESGNRKGFGYVTFDSVEDAKTVFNAKNGAYIGEGRSSRAVRLDYASQKPRGEGGFGGGRGGGGRGGGRGSFGGGFGGRGGGGRGGGRGGPRGGGRGGFGSSGRGGSRGFEGKKITF